MQKKYRECISKIVKIKKMVEQCYYQNVLYVEIKNQDL